MLKLYAVEELEQQQLVGLHEDAIVGVREQSAHPNQLATSQLLWWSLETPDSLPVLRSTLVKRTDTAVARLPKITGAKLGIVTNPVCGAGNSQDVCSQTILPACTLLGFTCKSFETRSENDAGRIASELFSKRDDSLTTVIVLGGDGTLHEFLQGVPSTHSPKIDFVLIPTGTANAFHSSLFPATIGSPFQLVRSFTSYLQQAGPQPLSLAKVTFSDHQPDLVGHVVISTALHAAILDTAESLRSTVSGLDRFKKAAQLNWSSLHSGKIVLKGTRTRYSPASRSFEPYTSVEESADWWYLSSLLIDRLEPAFIVAPLRKVANDAASLSGTIDLVAIKRPAHLGHDHFLPEMMKATGAIYDKGKHVDLVWSNGTVRPWAEGEADQGPVVTYLRCQGWEWHPVRV